jgi:hypothetical protein
MPGLYWPMQQHHAPYRGGSRKAQQKSWSVTRWRALEGLMRTDYQRYARISLEENVYKCDGARSL